MPKEGSVPLLPGKPPKESQRSGMHKPNEIRRLLCRATQEPYVHWLETKDGIHVTSECSPFRFSKPESGMCVWLRVNVNVRYQILQVVCKVCKMAINSVVNETSTDPSIYWLVWYPAKRYICQLIYSVESWRSIQHSLFYHSVHLPLYKWLWSCVELHSSPCLSETHVLLAIVVAFWWLSGWICKLQRGQAIMQRFTCNVWTFFREFRIECLWCEQCSKVFPFFGVGIPCTRCWLRGCVKRMPHDTIPILYS